MKNGKKFFLNSFAFLMSFLAISSVNSACAIIFGQEKEPDSLAKYKKYLPKAKKRHSHCSRNRCTAVRTAVCRSIGTAAARRLCRSV